MKKTNHQWAWPVLVLAAGFEVGWVVGLKYASTPLEWVTTAVAIMISFVLLIWTGRKLAVGTAYAVFVGLGTVGTALVDQFIFAEPMNLATILFMILLLVGVIGLKATAEAKVEEKGAE
ncbi:DMT family transporter [Halalkalibacter alkalisediminis]|uniref:DMT family transporter n=1 Tax=Halalkalibacter alkalisediminis TaxID=935616 RepID=A0ABV6NKI3_9BACI|nr:multidrug efflux SMR transporter [Halalkalibacter alkalisediminis]